MCLLGNLKPHMVDVLLVDGFVVARSKFPRTIRVNVISTACYSAIFAQKISED